MPKQPVPFAAKDFGESAKHIVLGEDDAVMTEAGVHRLLDTTQDAILVADGCDQEILPLCVNLVGESQIERLAVGQIADRVSLGGSAVLVTHAGSLGQTRLVLASALKRHGELRRAEHTGVLPALPELDDEPSFSLKPVAIGTGVALVAVLAGWLLLGQGPSLDEPADGLPGPSVPLVTNNAPPSTSARRAWLRVRFNLD